MTLSTRGHPSGRENDKQENMFVYICTPQYWTRKIDEIIDIDDEERISASFKFLGH